MKELYFKTIKQEDYHNIMSLEYASFNERDRMKPEVFYNFVNDTDKEFIKMVDQEDNLIACIMLQIITINIEPYGYLYSIAVDKKYQQQGIAGICMTYIINYFRDMKVPYIELHVRRSNIPAIKLYEKFNFFEDQVVDDYYEDGDDALIFKKLL